MRRFVPDLDEPLIREAARHVFGLWSYGRGPEEHVAHQLAVLGRAGKGLMRYAGLVEEEGGLVASMKRYALALAIPGGAVVSAVGIGAVFTRPDARGTGAASELLRAVMAEAAAEGAGAALLFSDIDPGFYERLGFVALPGPEHLAPTSALPATTPLALRPATEADEAAMLDAFDRSFGPSFLRPARTLASFRFFRWRNQADAAWILSRGGRDVGYVLAGLDDPTRDLGTQLPQGSLWVDEWAAPGVATEEVLGALRQLAERLGASTVAGWLRPEQAAPPFTSRPRAASLPMVAPLAPPLRAKDIRPERAWLGSVDHF